MFSSESTQVAGLPLLDSAVFPFQGSSNDIKHSSMLHPESVNIKVLMEQDGRRRRQWSEEEDEALREAVRIEHPEGGAPYKWLEIARHIPGRSNKDCRKRWYNKMSSPQTLKGGWSPDEDALLIKAVKRYGNKWPLVSAMVGTRKSCQCARRWYDTLDPSIDKAPWSREEDERLIAAVSEHGKKWSFISKTCFPRRTGLAAKNRFFALVNSSLRRRGGDYASQSDRPKYTSYIKPDPYEVPIDLLWNHSTPDLSPADQSSHRNVFDFDMCSTSASSSSSSSRMHSPSVSSSDMPPSPSDSKSFHMARQQQHCPLATALNNFEFELSCQLKAVSSLPPLQSSFPSPISPISPILSSPYHSESPTTSPTWDLWDPEILNLLQGSDGRRGF